MAEKIISPGVFTNEIDQSFLPSAIADIGAAIIGPTIKGPAGVPTVVTSYSDFQNKFGDVHLSGSTSFQFSTSHAAQSYLQHSNFLDRWGLSSIPRHSRVDASRVKIPIRSQGLERAVL